MANELEQQIGAVLNNPDLMQKIMTIAGSLSPENDEGPEKKPSAGPPADLAAIQKLTGLASQAGIDPQQQSLLAALSPYLSKYKIQKLENAMRAAKMTRLATSFINPQKSSR